MKCFLAACGLVASALLASGCGGVEPATSGQPSTSGTSTAMPAPTPVNTPVVPASFATIAPKPLAGWTCEMFDPNRDEPGIYVYDIETCAVSRLTNGPTDGYSLNWAPDGKKLAFSRYDSTDFAAAPVNSDIYIKDIQTRVETRLTETQTEQELQPAWSHDGNFVSFESVPFEHWQNPRRHTQIHAAEISAPEQVRVLVEGTCYPRHSWSPTRQEILLASQCDEMSIIDANGQIVTRFEMEEVLWDDPIWAPDGNSFALMCNFYANNYSATVCTVSRDGSAVVQVAEDGLFPTWTPASEVSYAGSGKLYVADGQTGEATRIIEGWRGEYTRWVSGGRIAATVCTYENVAPCGMVWALVDPVTLGTAYISGIGCGSASEWSPNGRYLAIAVGRYPVACG